MAMRDAINSREFDKFEEVDGETTVRTSFASGQLGSLLQGVSFDYIEASYPSVTKEVYTYKLGGPTGTQSAVIEVEYTTSAKEFVDSVWRTA